MMAETTAQIAHKGHFTVAAKLLAVLVPYMGMPLKPFTSNCYKA